MEQGESCPRNLQFRLLLSVMSGCGSLRLLPPDCVSLDKALVCKYSRVSLEIILSEYCVCLVWLFRPVMFGSTRSLWAIQSLASSHLGSVGRGLPLLERASGSIRPLLATLTSSVPPLPQHILQAEQIIGKRFCGWLSVHICVLVACRVPSQIKGTRI